MKSSTSYYWWKFNSEKIISEWVQDGEPEIQAKNFRIRIDWVAAWAKKTISGSQSEQAQRERIHLCSEVEMKDHLHQGREIEELIRCYQEEIQKNSEDWKNFLRSMIRNHEQWVYCLIKHEDHKNDWSFIEDSKIFQDPDSPSSYEVPTFCIKLLSPRAQES